MSTAPKGRTHDCKRPAASRDKTLAIRGPSTHDPSRLEALEAKISTTSMVGGAANLPRSLEAPNWGIWKLRESWTISEFGALLAGVDPSDGPISRAAINCTKLVYDHVGNQKLAYIPQFEDRQQRIKRRVDHNTRISRDAALNWAKQQGLDVSKLN